MTVDRLRVLLIRTRDRSGPADRRLLTARLAWVDELAGRFTHLRPPLGDDRPPH
ncbi:hypothetical protein [Rhodococcus sp. NPDC058514]|uniref:hypothetical protein n=1 Tax=unclassified Rhodococcus (in: high G+C Gram-positive bacteria) TaxID=192944 RepID=UPI00365D464F